MLQAKEHAINLPAILTLGVGALLAALAVGFGFGPLELRDEGLTLFGQVLGTLLVVSAVMERALDVLLTILRAATADELDKDINRRKETLREEQQAGAVRPQTKSALEKAQKTRAAYRARTLHLAMAAGFWVGILVAAIGMRVLQSLVDPATLQALEGTRQGSAFAFLDVVLTGAVLAGGSDGIHKLVEVYRNYTKKGAAKGAEE